MGRLHSDLYKDKKNPSLAEAVQKSRGALSMADTVAAVLKGCGFSTFPESQPGFAIDGGHDEIDYCLVWSFGSTGRVTRQRFKFVEPLRRAGFAVEGCFGYPCLQVRVEGFVTDRRPATKFQFLEEE